MENVLHDIRKNMERYKEKTLSDQADKINITRCTISYFLTCMLIDSLVHCVNLAMYDSNSCDYSLKLKSYNAHCHVLLSGSLVSYIDLVMHNNDSFSELNCRSAYV